ncbi:MAG TPA: hypothetical protein PKG60_11165 [Spirochaetota bacterium]|nr:hypothetical protein [Spirochaetota bacterium]
MISKMIKSVILMVACITFASCSGDSRSLIEGRMVDTLTNKALNSTTSTTDDSTSSTKTKSKTKYSGEATGDRHYVDADVIFVSKDAFKGSGWMYVKAAKVITPASSKTKNEGQFMVIDNGDEIWTKNYWKTRIASEKELKLGLVIIAFDDNEDGVYIAPNNKSDAINDNWFMAKITDMSDKYQGYVTVSGGYKVSLENLRVVVK